MRFLHEAISNLNLINSFSSYQSPNHVKDSTRSNESMNLKYVLIYFQQEFDDLEC